jgi:nicotinate-nucleotide--dimethylbenzimidazole phosphoribosyltransferase
MAFISATYCPFHNIPIMTENMERIPTLLEKELRHRIDHKTKPIGSLGRLEEIALQVGLIQQTTDPCIRHPHILVFAGDHGIAATGLVNPFPQAVTAQMVLNFIHGGAAINVFCRQHDILLLVVDAGVNADFDPGLSAQNFIHAKIGHGTRNYLGEPAMTPEEVQRALDKGRDIVETVGRNGCNCVGFGEMGIGNSSAAALIMSRVTGIPIEECVGRGTGVDGQQLQTKTETLKQAFRLRFPRTDQPIQPEDILMQVGGFEMAMMTGAYLQAAERNMLIVVDGFIATAALLIAGAMDDKVLSCCIFAHTSGEQGHERMLHWLGAKPLLNLGMRLGEGTGAVLAMPLIQSAVGFLSGMASFETAGVSNKEQ